ncbi:hypothetical protein GGX14DRAFT_576588 [Mycena pura]|uniref:Uncharacterized protein n=1 Tax=Mycena pura TaxID=153505 RepID=A0AAD6Y120_9AGAR|nr:hypothetical protein GGX14DRAFT_576588 [Mycena pura]
MSAWRRAAEGWPQVSCAENQPEIRDGANTSTLKYRRLLGAAASRLDREIACVAPQSIIRILTLHSDEYYGRRLARAETDVLGSLHDAVLDTHDLSSGTPTAPDLQNARTSHAICSTSHATRSTRKHRASPTASTCARNALIYRPSHPPPPSFARRPPPAARAATRYILPTSHKTRGHQMCLFPVRTEWHMSCIDLRPSLSLAPHSDSDFQKSPEISLRALELVAGYPGHEFAFYRRLSLQLVLPARFRPPTCRLVVATDTAFPRYYVRRTNDDAGLGCQCGRGTPVGGEASLCLATLPRTGTSRTPALRAVKNFSSPPAPATTSRSLHEPALLTTPALNTARTSTFAVLFVFVYIWHQVARRTHSLLSPRLATLAEDALEPNVSFDRPVGRMSSSSGLPFHVNRFYTQSASPSNLLRSTIPAPFGPIGMASLSMQAACMTALLLRIGLNLNLTLGTGYTSAVITDPFWKGQDGGQVIEQYGCEIGAWRWKVERTSTSLVCLRGDLHWDGGSDAVMIVQVDVRIVARNTADSKSVFTRRAACKQARARAVELTLECASPGSNRGAKEILDIHTGQSCKWPTLRFCYVPSANAQAMIRDGTFDPVVDSSLSLVGKSVPRNSRSITTYASSTRYWRSSKLARADRRKTGLSTHRTIEDTDVDVGFPTPATPLLPPPSVLSAGASPSASFALQFRFPALRARNPPLVAVDVALAAVLLLLTPSIFRSSPAAFAHIAPRARVDQCGAHAPPFPSCRLFFTISPIRLAVSTLSPNATHFGGYAELDVHNMWGLTEEMATHLALKSVLPGAVHHQSCSLGGAWRFNF